MPTQNTAKAVLRDGPLLPAPISMLQLCNAGHDDLSHARKTDVVCHCMNLNQRQFLPSFVSLQIIGWVTFQGRERGGEGGGRRHTSHSETWKTGLHEEKKKICPSHAHLKWWSEDIIDTSSKNDIPHEQAKQGSEHRPLSMHYAGPAILVGIVMRRIALDPGDGMGTGRGLIRHHEECGRVWRAQLPLYKDLEGLIGMGINREQFECTQCKGDGYTDIKVTFMALLLVGI